MAYAAAQQRLSQAASRPCKAQHSRTPALHLATRARTPARPAPCRQRNALPVLCSRPQEGDESCVSSSSSEPEEPRWLSRNVQVQQDVVAYLTTEWSYTDY